MTERRRMTIGQARVVWPAVTALAVVLTGDVAMSSPGAVAAFMAVLTVLIAAVSVAVWLPGFKDW